MPDKSLISIILPTQHSANTLNRLLDSIESTVVEIDKIEVVIYINDDNFESQAIERSVFNLVKLIDRRTTWSDMIRKCYEVCSSPYILLLNDDAIFRTHGWDTKILQAFSKHPDDIALVWCNDLSHGENMPLFPAYSRKLCELMGGVCPEDYYRDYINIHLLDIFKKLHNLGYNRLEYLQDVILEHLHQEADTVTVNDTYIKPRFSDDELTYIAWEHERQIIVDSIAKYIQQSTLCAS